MAAPTRPSVIVFDVNETLLDLETVTPLFARLFGDAAVMREWFAQMVLYSQTVSLAHAYVPFGTIGVACLRMIGTIKGVAITSADTDELKTRILSMPALPDVAPALKRLRAAGFRLTTLTNSAPNPDVVPLKRAGLDAYFEAMLSVDAVRHFKPAPETYRAVTDALGIAPVDMCLVAAHVWDTLGAQLFGASAALVLRPGNAPLPLPGLPQPTIVAADMGALADAMIARWR